MSTSAASAKSIFLQAVELPSGDERRVFLDAQCGGQADLRRQVEELLRHYGELNSFLETPPTAVANLADTAREAAAAGVATLSFLLPSQRPGSLGRLGHYEILEIVGSGGFGVVLKAQDEKLQRVVAIKTLAESLAASATARKRFVREAQAAAAVRHDNVVDIHAVEEAGPVPYLVMEFVDGISLEEKLKAEGPLELKEVLRIGLQIAEGLAAAHKQGLVHRDVKPANILLENSIQRVKITDFGLARAVDDASLTGTGMIAGTPSYMSPEQARGDSVDHRSDLFSLGSVLYAMCTGHAPFRGSTMLGVVKRVCEEQARPIRELHPEVPDWLCAIVTKLHNKNPAGRYQSAQEVADLLDGHLAQLQEGPSALPVVVTVPRSMPGLPRVRGRQSPPLIRRWLLGATAAMIVLGVTLGLTEMSGVTHLAATVIRIFTPSGTLIVETDDPAVKLTIEGDGGLVITGAGPQEVRLRPGNYRLRADKDGQPVRPDRELIAITRGDKQVVRVRLEGGTPASARTAAKPEPQPFVVLGIPGVAERKFDTLAEAVLAASNGDTIEIRASGPFDTQPISIEGHALTIRAGQAYRPVIRLKQEGLDDGASIFVTDAPLVLEGLELRLAGQSNPERPEFGPDAVVCKGAPLHMANCTLLNQQNRPRTGLLLLHESRQCELRNCLFLAANGSLLHWPLPADQGELVMNNCVRGGNITIHLHTLHNPLDISLQVTRTTTVTIFPLFSFSLHRPLDLPTQAIRLKASENVFETGGSFFRLIQDPGFYQTSQPLAAAQAQALVPRLLDWHGERNLYSVRSGYLALSVGKFGSELLPPATPIETLKEWNRFLNTEDTDSLEGRARYQGGALLARIRTALEQLTPDDFRLRADSPGYRAGKDGKDLGADIDLVGPGEAYERWKKTPEYQQWLKETGQSK